MNVTVVAEGETTAGWGGAPRSAPRHAWVSQHLSWLLEQAQFALVRCQHPPLTTPTHGTCHTHLRHTPAVSTTASRPCSSLAPRHAHSPHEPLKLGGAQRPPGHPHERRAKKASRGLHLAQLNTGLPAVTTISTISMVMPMMVMARPGSCRPTARTEHSWWSWRATRREWLPSRPARSSGAGWGVGWGCFGGGDERKGASGRHPSRRVHTLVA